MVQRTVRSTPIDRPSIDWKGAGPVALALSVRPIHLIAGGIAAHLMDAGQRQHRAGAVGGRGPSSRFVRTSTSPPVAVAKGGCL